jgi:sarcosine oxidase delta subunit
MNPDTKPLSTADLARAGEADVKRPPMPPARRMDEGHASLFRDNDADDLRRRWTDIQGGFVDEPRKAVEQADSLVADVMKRLAEGFTSERAGLEKQWDRGDNVTTEDLRVALQKYRSFFDRLLAV